MEIVRERFLDESKLYHLTLGVRSRTTEMHSVLSALTADERDAVGKALARALDEITGVVTPRLAAIESVAAPVARSVTA
jgi:truncated hemoglobin YjbI